MKQFIMWSSFLFINSCLQNIRILSRYPYFQSALSSKWHNNPKNSYRLSGLKQMEEKKSECGLPNDHFGRLTSVTFFFIYKKQIRERTGSQVWQAFDQDRLFCIDSVIMIRHLNPRSENILPSHDAQLELQSMHETTQFRK